MVAISPDTSPRFAGGYRAGAPFIEGFSQNHMSGVGCNGDLGNILLMPSVGRPDHRGRLPARLMRRKLPHPAITGSS